MWVDIFCYALVATRVSGVKCAHVPPRALSKYFSEDKRTSEDMPTSSADNPVTGRIFTHTSFVSHFYWASATSSVRRRIEGKFGLAPSLMPEPVSFSSSYLLLYLTFTNHCCVCTWYLIYIDPAVCLLDIWYARLCVNLSMQQLTFIALTRVCELQCTFCTYILCASVGELGSHFVVRVCTGVYSEPPRFVNRYLNTWPMSCTLYFTNLVFWTFILTYWLSYQSSPQLSTRYVVFI